MSIKENTAEPEVGEPERVFSVQDVPQLGLLSQLRPSKADDRFLAVQEVNSGEMRDNTASRGVVFVHNWINEFRQEESKHD